MLNKCKKCGAPADIIDFTWGDGDLDDRSPFYMLDCPNCPQRVCPFDRDHMIAAWNALNPATDRSWAFYMLARVMLALIAGFGLGAIGIWLDLPMWFVLLVAVVVQWLFWKVLGIYEDGV